MEMKKMSNSMKYLIVAVTATVFSFICCLFAIIASGFELLGIVGIAVAVVALSFYIIFLTALIANKCGKKAPSPCGVFAIVDLILMLGTSIYVVYDITTGVGWFAGLVGVFVGVLLLIYVLPCMLLLLMIDGVVALVIWRKKRKKEFT